MIEIEDLTVAYGDRIAVDALRFSVAEGTFVGILGPNGAGKSSLIGAICGVVPPRSGRIRIAGLDPYRERARVTARLGYVPQDLAFHETLTARQNLQFFGRVHGLFGAPLRRAIDRVLDFVQLAARADERVGSFSGGMKRRLNVAIGLLHEPELLILDEPTTGVDAQSRSALLGCFEALGRAGTTLLYTTHRIDEVQQLCTRVAIMDRGRLMADDPPAALIERFATGRLRVCFSAPPPDAIAQVLLAAGVASEAACQGTALEAQVRRAGPALALLAERAGAIGLAIESLELPEPSLESVFLQLTGRHLRDGDEGTAS